jgi:short subunit fatty acids transporter
VYAPYASYLPYGYPAARRTNALAIVALVISFFFWPVGLVCGHIARRQIARSGESGRGLATAALVIGYLEFAFVALLILARVASS